MFEIYHSPELGQYPKMSGFMRITLQKLNSKLWEAIPQRGHGAIKVKERNSKNHSQCEKIL